MASTKTTKPAAKAPRKPAAKAVEAPSGRRKSKLTQAGDRAKWETERDLLLATLRAKDWHLTHTAAELEMSGVVAVLHALDRYELREAYERARSKKAAKQAG